MGKEKKVKKGKKGGHVRADRPSARKHDLPHTPPLESPRHPRKRVGHISSESSEEMATLGVAPKHKFGENYRSTGYKGQPSQEIPPSFSSTDLSSLKTRKSLDRNSLPKNSDRVSAGGFGTQSSVNSRGAITQRRNSRPGPYAKTVRRHDSHKIFENIGLYENMLSKSTMAWTVDHVGSLKGHSKALTGLCFLGQNLLASCAMDGTIRIWDIATQQPLSMISLGASVIFHSISLWSPGVLVAGGDNNAVEIFAVKGNAGELAERLQLGLELAPKIYRLIQKKKSWDHIATLRGHEAPILAVIRLSKRKIASSSRDNTIKIWSHRGACLVTLVGHTQPVWALSKLGGGKLASGSHDGTIRIWDVAAGTTLRKIDANMNYIFALRSLSNGLLLSSSWQLTHKRKTTVNHRGNYTGVVQVWEVETGALKGVHKGHSDWIKALGTLANDRLMLTGAMDGGIKVWDVNTGVVLKTVKGHNKPIVSIEAVSGNTFVSCSGSHTIRLWSVSNNVQADVLLPILEAVCPLYEKVGEDDKYVDTTLQIAKIYLEKGNTKKVEDVLLRSPLLIRNVDGLSLLAESYGQEGDHAAMMETKLRIAEEKHRVGAYEEAEEVGVGILAEDISWEMRTNVLQVMQDVYDSKGDPRTASMMAKERAEILEQHGHGSDAKEVYDTLAKLGSSSVEVLHTLVQSLQESLAETSARLTLVEQENLVMREEVRDLEGRIRSLETAEHGRAGEEALQDRVELRISDDSDASSEVDV